MYGLPPYRFSSYAIGVVTGQILLNSEKPTMSQNFLNFGWLFATLGLILTSTLTYINHLTFNPFYMALFAAFSPTFLCLFFGWLIYISYHDVGSKFKINFFEVIC
jgi:hypothetical protein